MCNLAKKHLSDLWRDEIGELYYAVSPTPGYIRQIQKTSNDGCKYIELDSLLEWPQKVLIHNKNTLGKHVNLIRNTQGRKLVLKWSIYILEIRQCLVSKQFDIVQGVPQNFSHFVYVNFSAFYEARRKVLYVLKVPIPCRLPYLILFIGSF